MTKATVRTRQAKLRQEQLRKKQEEEDLKSKGL